ncbi:MAG: hypothetical protein WCI45_05765 [Desulfuromonadales bacterium]
MKTVIGKNIFIKICANILFFLMLVGCVNTQVRSSMEAQGYGFSPPSGTYNVPLTNMLSAYPVSTSGKLSVALVIPNSLVSGIKEQRIACSLTDFKYIIRTGKQFQLSMLGQLNLLFGNVDIISNKSSVSRTYDLYIEPSIPEVSIVSRCNANIVYDYGQLEALVTGSVIVKDPLGRIIFETQYNKSHVGVLTQGLQNSANPFNKFIISEERYPADNKVEHGPIYLAIALNTAYSLAISDVLEQLKKSESFRTYLPKLGDVTPIMAITSTKKQINTKQKEQPATVAQTAKRPLKEAAPPTITIVSPIVKRGSKVVVRENPINIVGKVENTIGINSVTVNGQQAALDERGNFSMELQLKVGKNPIIVEALDINNNRSVERFTVTGTVSSSAIAEVTSSIQQTKAVPAVQNEALKVNTDGLKTLLAKNDLEGLRVYLDKHPEELSSIKNASLRLRYTGPPELRIIDIAQLVKEGKNDQLIIAQINSVAGPYKKFSVSELAALKKMAISDKLVVAMITVTTEYTKEQKRIQVKQNIPEPVPQPMQQVQQPLPQQQQQQTAPESNVLTDCLKLAAAIRLCDQAGGFVAYGCKALARTQFTCPTL